MGRVLVRSLIARFCAAAVLVAGITPATGLTYCFGLDGHVDLGSLADGCTDCGEGDASPGDSATCDDLGPPCCPCIDVSVNGSPAGVNRGSAGSFSLPCPADVALVTTFFHDAIGPASTTRRSTAPPPSRSAPVALLRGVILQV